MGIARFLGYGEQAKSATLQPCRKSFRPTLRRRLRLLRRPRLRMLRLRPHRLLHLRCRPMGIAMGLRGMGRTTGDTGWLREDTVRRGFMLR